MTKMMMKRILLCLAMLFVETLFLCSFHVVAQSQSRSSPATKEIAITIDDVPLNARRFDLSRLQTMTDTLLSGIKSHQLPAVGFVNQLLPSALAQPGRR